MPARAILLAAAAWLLADGAALRAADLKPVTIAAFDRYIQSTEARIQTEVADPGRFLWVDGPAPRDRAGSLEALRRGGLVIERLTSTDQGRAISVPDGLIHHWLGLVFLPGVRLDDAVQLLQDYDRHAAIYAPRVNRSALRSHDGDRFAFSLRFLMTKVITVVIDSDHDARFTRPSSDRVYSRIVSTRMAEVESHDTPNERTKPEGRDGGYLWRLNSYWRFLERDGGTYLQCESVSLTRGIPLGLGWLVGPFVTSLPRETLEFTLLTTKRALVR